MPNWIALYDGNAVDLIDSVSVPVLAADESFELSKDFKTWEKAIAGSVTQAICLKTQV